MDISGQVILMLQLTNRIPFVPSSLKILAKVCIYMVASAPALWLACSRLSDSREDAKEKGTRKFGGAGKRKKEGTESL